MSTEFPVPLPPGPHAASCTQPTVEFHRLGSSGFMPSAVSLGVGSLSRLARRGSTPCSDPDAVRHATSMLPDTAGMHAHAVGMHAHALGSGHGPTGLAHGLDLHGVDWRQARAARAEGAAGLTLSPRPPTDSCIVSHRRASAPRWAVVLHDRTACTGCTVLCWGA